MVRTTCPYCGVGCGINARVTAARSVEISGDAAHPANLGKLCSKGTHLGETVALEGRLLHPEIAGQRATWDAALDHVAAGFTAAIRDHGPDSVAFYVSGQLLTEDYYVANKLMKGFIGSGNIDTNSRLCMASAVAGHVRAFGEDVVPGCYDDIDHADLIILVGSNTAWCHPVLYQRIVAAQAARGAKLVVIDPRRTESCEAADLHLPLRSGSDLALFEGLLAWLARHDLLDNAFTERHVAVPDGFFERLARTRGFAETVADTGLDPEALLRFFNLFADNPRTLTLFSQGINQSTKGTDQVGAILNLHLATGRIGKPGAAPFSITGQPNAMGGREVGGLANTLAAHMGFEHADLVQRFWGAPTIARQPGLKAVQLFDAVAAGKIKALWIIATNPLVSLPDSEAVRAGLANCPLVVVSDCSAATDTGALATVRLPAAAWGEKDGTVTNSERRISRQRALFALPGQARPDWWALTEVARRMGFGAAFDYATPAEIFREHAALSAFENTGARLFNIGAHAAIDADTYQNLEPFQWPACAGDSSDATRLFTDGRFPTADGRARLVIPANEAPAGKGGLVLNTGRYRDQWHTMTRTGLSPKLSAHRTEPALEIHPDDARDLTDGALATLTTAQGSSVFRVRLNSTQRRGEIFVPIHWSRANSSGGRTGALCAPDCDPHSGQPAFKSSRASVTPLATAWTGYMFSAAPLTPDGALWWTRARVAGGWLTELAGDGGASAFADALLGPGADRIEIIDRARGGGRWAQIRGGRVAAALFLTTSGTLPSRDWLMRNFGGEASHLELLAGRPATAAPDTGTQICVCFDIGLNTIVNAIIAQTLVSVEAVGNALGAGSNCGSCRPAIAALLREHAPQGETVDV